ncbi:MAG: ZIP family metal transporter [Candidatus Adlerbacteria bacterium]|nr:ZIP family metal transporter [Candidatus Adlerbacteria bacterium]
MFEILVASIGIMLASLVGKISTWRWTGGVLERNLDFLTSFSAGVFLIVAYYLAAETLEHTGNIGEGIAWILAGALSVWLLFKVLPALHHHRPHGHEYEGHTIDPRRLLISDGLHNVGDGIVLATAFSVSMGLGAVAALSVFVHELVQEISEFFVLREGGYSVRRALSLNFLVSSTILVGALGAYFLLDLFELIEVPLLGLSAGAFLVVVLGDLIPHSLKATNGYAHTLKHLFWFAAGAILMFLISTLGGH